MFIQGFSQIIGQMEVNNRSYLPQQIYSKKGLQMETIRSVINILQPQDVMAKTDLREAYLHMPILPSHRRFLRIAASLVFTKLVVFLAAALRLKGDLCYLLFR